MQAKAGAQIGKKAFIQSILILFGLMMAAGVLTLVVPAGQYARITVGGRETIDPQSFQYSDRPDYPIWRWFVAPVEVLGSSSGLTVIVIIVVLFFAGGAFAVLGKTGTIGAFIGGIVRRFRHRKYTLLPLVCLAFIFLGSTLGTFEEVALLTPMMIALSYSLGWDVLAGPFVPFISDYALPLVGVLFLIGGLGAGLLSGAGARKVWRGLTEGVGGLLPSVLLILMAASIRYIIDRGGVTDTMPWGSRW